MLLGYVLVRHPQFLARAAVRLSTTSSTCSRGLAVAEIVRRAEPRAAPFVRMVASALE